MCRLLYFSGSKSEIDLAFHFIDSLVKASYKDPTCPFDPPQHGDGFGYVIAGFKENEPCIYFYKSVKPIFNPRGEVEVAQMKEMKETLKELDRFCISLHSRRLLSGDKNFFNAHPYFYFTDNCFSFFLSHNGTLVKSELLPPLKISKPNEFSDTYMFGLRIQKELKEVDEDSLKSIFKKFAEYVKDKSALNTITLFLDAKAGKTKAFLTNYYVKDADPDYYKIYVLQNSELFAFTSSGVHYYLDEKTKVQMEPLSNGSSFYIEDVFSHRTIPAVHFR